MYSARHHDKIWGRQFALMSPTPNSGARVPSVPRDFRPCLQVLKAPKICIIRGQRMKLIAQCIPVSRWASCSTVVYAS